MNGKQSLSDFLNFEQHRNKTAFVEQSLYRTQKYSYFEIAEGTSRIISSLRQLSIQEGDRIILWGQNSSLWAMTFYACVLSRVVVVPVDASFSLDFVHKIQTLTQASLVLSDSEGANWARLLDRPPSEKIQAQNSPEENTLLEIIYTSGTTGEPKGVMITHGNILSNLIPIRQEYEKYALYAIPFSPLGFVHLIPLSHLFGQIMGLFIPQMLGATVVFTDPGPAGVVSAVRRNRASALICVPKELALLSRYVTKRYQVKVSEKQKTGVVGILARWWRFRQVHREFGWKFWAFIVGGATLPEAEESFWNGLGFAVIQGYGLTETAPAVTITHPFKGIKRGRVGKKLPGLEVKIAEDGEILVRGPNVSPGYYHNEIASREVFREGWLHTGDLGRFDEDGNLQLLGRKKEMIVTSEGLNVYPEDLEAVLNGDTRVRESAVVARELRGGHAVHAVLVLEYDVLPAEASRIIGAANERLESFQRIQSFSIWPEKKLPRTSTGKLKRLAIAQVAAGQTVAEKTAEDLVERLLAGVSGSETLEEDLGLSSLDRVELLVELERKAGVQIDDAAFARSKSLSDIARLVREPVRPERHYPEWKWPQWNLIRWLRNVLLYVLVFPVLRIRVKVQVSGTENLSGLKPPVLFVSNHQSIVDVPVILRALPFSLRHRICPAMGGWRRRFEHYAAAFFFNTYPLPNTSIGLREALRHTGNLADRGYCPLVFPEGERTLDGNLMPFRPGIGVVAKQIKLQMVPITIRGLFEIWPVFARGPGRKGTVQLHFGPRFDFTGKEPAEITSELESWFQNNFPSGSTVTSNEHN